MRKLLILLVFPGLFSCTNNPYPEADSNKNYYYSSFGEAPKHLDPAISYSEGDYIFMQQIYEPVVQYHFLKRPYELIPLTAAEVPKPTYFDKANQKLTENAPEDAVARAVYTVQIRPGIRYQNHPGFAKDSAGKPLYFSLKAVDLEGIEDVGDFPSTDTRELIAADYVWQIKRLANPILQCPILSILEQYIEGLDEYSATLTAEVGRIRSERKRAAGALYNQETDELENPIFLDLEKFDFPGVRIVDRYTYEIVLKKKYPQMRYWFAMPFFAPIPREVDRFYAQGPLVAKRISFETNPIGTGPFRMERFAPNAEIVLTRNENYHGESYPTEGMPQDQAAGYLEDAGKPLPFLDKAIYKYETEALPRWGKFTQGYFDASGIISDVFGQAVNVSESGLDISDSMRAKGIALVKEPRTTIDYYNFNMLDPVVGGYTPDRKKLRQAVAIAIDAEEYIEIFRNGRDQAAQGPIPPGIFGYLEDREAMNPFIYDWDEKAGKPRRKPIEVAKKLLAEAGYPGGRDKSGKPLVLYYDNALAGAESKAYLDWMRRQFAKIDVDLEVRSTDYNRFQDKAKKGNFQILDWGWNADYPDPENFMFLLYGPNAKAKFDGENNSNYDSPEFNRLFDRMATMENTPERLDVIRRMTRLVQEDMPWIPSFYPVDFTLYHAWEKNTKPMPISDAVVKYRKVDPQLRNKFRAEWNKPNYWPLLLFIPALAVLIVPAWLGVRRRQRRSAISS